MTRQLGAQIALSAPDPIYRLINIENLMKDAPKESRLSSYMLVKFEIVFVLF